MFQGTETWQSLIVLGQTAFVAGAMGEMGTENCADTAGEVWDPSGSRPGTGTMDRSGPALPRAAQFGAQPWIPCLPGFAPDKALDGRMLVGGMLLGSCFNHDDGPPSLT